MCHQSIRLGKIVGLLLVIVLVAGCAGLRSALPAPTATSQAASIVPTQASLPCPAGSFVTSIASVQGAGHRSPLDGRTGLCLSGIITAIKSNGFYMQDPMGDGKDATSEGIFVEVRSAFQVSKGDQVLVWNANVKEYNPAGVGENSLTITNLRLGNYQVLSSGNALPAPIVLGRGGRAIPSTIIENDVNGYAGRNGIFDPLEDGLDFYESLEGMLVQVNDALAISPTASFKEVAILADGGQDAGLLSDRNILLATEADFNPERIFIDDAFVNIPNILPGARFTKPIVGIMDYSFGNFKLEPTGKLQFMQGKPVINEVRAPEESELSIATYNVENLDAITYPDRLTTLAKDIVWYLHSPDILVLQEIQDNDGELDSRIVSASQTMDKLIAAVQKQGGPTYTPISIDPLRNADGGVQGGNIRVVILYRSDAGLQLANAPEGNATDPNQVLNKQGKAVLSLNPGRVAPGNSAFQSSRKPLAAQFSYKGESLFIIANHLNSKGEDGPLFGEIQPPPLASEAQRVAQARVINAFVADILAIEPSARVVVLGDLNDYPWSKPIQTLSGNELQNAMEQIPGSDRYTYIHEGNGQVLDHILVSNRLAKELTLVAPIHLNTENLPSGRLSDHDPVVAYFLTGK